MKVENVRTDQFNQIVRALQSVGWMKIEEYPRFGTWIDHGHVTFKRHGRTIRCDWTHWEEGSFEGPDAVLHSLQTFVSSNN